MLHVLKRADKSVEVVQLVLCGIIMLAIMWLTFFMVIFRYVLNDSIIWAEEILRYLMMWGVLVGAGLTTREDQHVCMDLLQSVLKRWPKIQSVHYVFTRLIVFAFMIYLWGPTMDLVVQAGNSTATSVTWLYKSVVYSAFFCGIISVNLSLLGQVPRKVYHILNGIMDDELILDAQAKANEFDLMLEETNDKTDAPPLQEREETRKSAGNETDDGGNRR